MREIAVIGATGYVGARLVPVLLHEGHAVAALGRSTSKIAGRPYAAHRNLRIAHADVMDEASLCAALEGVGVAYYLVHSMNAATRDYAAADRVAAENMAKAAARAGVGRIIYLGGLGRKEDHLSRHLHSRTEVGALLSRGSVPVTWLRAAMILGSGSASFEIMRYLVDRLPVMIVPRWVDTKCQPIAIANVLDYLVGCLRSPETAGRSFDVGGPDVVSYGELFDIYAEEAGLPRRRRLHVPFFTPALSARWIHLVTPVPASIGRPLAEGLRNEAVCTEEAIRACVPVRLIGCREAIREALADTREDRVVSCWSDAGDIRPPAMISPGDPGYAGGAVLEMSYACLAQGAVAPLWKEVVAIGGRTGWLYLDGLWRLRGWFDRLIGGVGLTRGRRQGGVLAPGDALDCFRVLGLVENRLLLLRFNMRLPGEAVLRIALEEEGPDLVRLRLNALFRPRGLAGLVYWALLKPAHRHLFKGLLRTLVRRARLPLREPPTPYEGGREVCVLPEAEGRRDGLR